MVPLSTAYKLIRRILTESGQSSNFPREEGSLNSEMLETGLGMLLTGTDSIKTMHLARLRYCTLVRLTDLGRVALLLLIQTQLARSNADQLILCFR